MTTSPYPYLIFYEVTHEEIVIHAVRHGARDPSGMPGTE
jgi:plasmid stabilization system protein ParE